MTKMVYACFFFCCFFASGAMLCANVTDEVRGLCSFYNQTVEGYLPEIDRTRIIFHFRPLFQARCSPLTKIFFAQVCSRYVCLLEFSCHAVMFAFPFKRPATTFFCCTVFNGPNFLTAKNYLHVHVYVCFHRHQHHCFQFHLPLQYGQHLRLLLLRLLRLLHLPHLFLGITVLLYWARCFLLYLDFL